MKSVTIQLMGVSADSDPLEDIAKMLVGMGDEITITCLEPEPFVLPRIMHYQTQFGAITMRLDWMQGAVYKVSGDET